MYISSINLSTISHSILHTEPTQRITLKARKLQTVPFEFHKMNFVFASKRFKLYEMFLVERKLHDI